jgi:hypothetical protein
MKTSVSHGPDGERRKDDQPFAGICPASSQPILDDNDPTMPVLALSEDEVDFGYDPYDTGTFWAKK